MAAPGASSDPTASLTGSSFSPSRRQALQEEAAVRAVRSAQPHRMHHVVCYSDHHPHEVSRTGTGTGTRQQECSSSALVLYLCRLKPNIHHL